MAFIDTESLLSPISEAAPSGENLEYDPAFAALETAAAGKPEQQVGETIVEGEPPDWESVRRQATELLGRTKDLRVAMHLVRALLNEGLTLLRGLVERHWPTLHPQLDPDDGNDPAIRLNTFASLLDRGTLLSLRSGPLVRTQAFGGLSLRDIHGDGGTDSKKADSATIEGVFNDAELASLEATHAALLSATESLTALDAALDAAAGQGTDFSSLVQIVRQATTTLGPRLERRRAEAAGVGVESGAGSNDGSPAPRGAFNPAGEIRSRDDVGRAIDQICKYYERYEPSSPLPLLLGRCKRLVAMNFTEIVKDMVPDALDRLELITGKPPEPS
jgi:type VI secretion system protein ImpA